jgi:hypothetical protein
LSADKWLSKNWHLALRNGQIWLKLFCVYRGLLWYPSMPWSWSSLMAKGTGSYVRSGSEWCHPLWADRQLHVQKQAAIALPLLMDNWIIDSGSVGVLKATIFLSESAWRRTTKHSLLAYGEGRWCRWLWAMNDMWGFTCRGASELQLFDSCRAEENICELADTYCFITLY